MTTTRVRREFIHFVTANSSVTYQEGWATGTRISPNSALATAQALPKGCRLRDMTDGASNTIVFGELAGRNVLYRIGHKKSPASDPEAQLQAIVGGGTWGDI